MPPSVHDSAKDCADVLDTHPPTEDKIPIEIQLSIGGKSQLLSDNAGLVLQPSGWSKGLNLRLGNVFDGQLHEQTVFQKSLSLVEAWAFVQGGGSMGEPHQLLLLMILSLSTHQAEMLPLVRLSARNSVIRQLSAACSSAQHSGTAQHHP